MVLARNNRDLATDPMQKQLYQNQADAYLVMYNNCINNVDVTDPDPAQKVDVQEPSFVVSIYDEEDEEMEIFWHNMSNITKFKLYYKSTSSNTWKYSREIHNVWFSKETRYFNKYDWGISAVDRWGNESDIVKAEKRKMISAPSNRILTHDGDEEIDATWSPHPAAKEYHLYARGSNGEWYLEDIVGRNDPLRFSRELKLKYWPSYSLAIVTVDYQGNRSGLYYSTAWKK